MTLWGGRFASSMDQSLWELSESFSFDAQLAPYDIEGTMAHVRGLSHAKLLSLEEEATLLGVLGEILSEFRDGRFERGPSDEDVHMAIERRATELCGPVGQKIHTARSRNDQVATTLRLYTRHALDRVAESVLVLIDGLIEVADRYPGASLPGYTHLQRAQPVLLSHHLQAHCCALLRDVERILDARQRMNISPLGAGALAGTSLNIDPAFTASLLGFTQPFVNSMDAVSDRDFVAETLFVVSLLGIHLSRMGEELVLWTTSEFGFARLGDDFTTGSSMLPQKKNADVAELARGKSGRMIGNLTGLLATLKSLPMSYNRDLQEDKEPLFDSIRQVSLVLHALSGAYLSLEWNVEVAAAAAGDEALVAIDLAEQLVAHGVPFRVAHERVGALVGRAFREQRSLAELVVEDEELAAHRDLFRPGIALAQRRSPGAAGPLAALVQRERLDDELRRTRVRLEAVSHR